MARRKSDTAADMLSRVVASSVGGFAFASAAVIALSYLLPGARIEAVIGASLTGFVFWTIAAIWSFAARTSWHAWAGLLMTTALFAAIAMLGRLVWP